LSRWTWRLSNSTGEVPPTVLWVVEDLDVAEYVGSGILTVDVDLAADAFALDELEKSLRNRVVLTVPATAHARYEIVVA
jgi:hypothetical protein